MAEYNLDKRQDKLPYDVVCELSSKYKRDYDRLISAEKSKAKQMAKETRRIKRNKRFLSLRRLIFLMFVLLFLASSFLYAGFAVNRYIGYGIIGLTAISLAISAICFILAVFRAIASEMGPTLPRYMVAMMMHFPKEEREGVRFLVRPTVAVALTVS